jgi:sensor histidine kinase regulating citrate/malate metabolism
LASLKDAFIALDSQQRYTYVNNNAAEMLGSRKQRTYYIALVCGTVVWCGRATTNSTEKYTQSVMLGHNVWQHMTDVESGIIAHSLEKAMREELDVVFEYYSEPRKCWCVI